MRKFKGFLLVSLIVLVGSGVAFAGIHPKDPGEGGGQGSVHSVVEPATIILLGAGLASLGFFAAKKKKK
jgi:hypothetical protein